jgi:hypothetical protein
MGRPVHTQLKPLTLCRVRLATVSGFKPKFFPGRADPSWLWGLEDAKMIQIFIKTQPVFGWGPQVLMKEPVYRGSLDVLSLGFVERTHASGMFLKHQSPCRSSAVRDERAFFFCPILPFLLVSNGLYHRYTVWICMMIIIIPYDSIGWLMT